MAYETFSVNMDETLKKQFDSLCSDLGMTASMAVNVFARALVSERKIPFEIMMSEDELMRENDMQVFWAIREQAKKNFPNGMTLEEINEEIRKVRYGEDDEE
ncbi:MAG: type II toxin-antitoxin system RelB/DinJ family antitoxin [Oscillospiraceae bacterium]|nr:type II toxin-antitoxin system RelB/DinJ family antitoxin [Oscillospiraceae bacterium]